MSKDDKEAKKEELLEKQEARQLTEEELEQVTGGLEPWDKELEGDIVEEYEDPRMLHDVIE